MSSTLSNSSKSRFPSPLKSNILKAISKALGGAEKESMEPKLTRSINYSIINYNK